MKKFVYKSIFSYGSLQFCGHVEEYLAENTEKLIVFVINPRVKNKYNLIRTYAKGKLLKEKKVRSSENIFLYYFLWYFCHWYILLTFFSKKEKFLIFGGHPLCFFGMGIQKLFRNVSFAYWIGDYFPGEGFIIKSFEKVKKHFHDRVDFACYLSDSINKIFNNGKILNSSSRKTVMWGVDPKRIQRSAKTGKFYILFIGLIKDSQGLEFLFSFLEAHKEYYLDIIGVCEKSLYTKYKALIKSNKIDKQIYFPNKFFSDVEIDKLSKRSNVGIALYNIDSSNPTFYTDPGKVKAYVELGLPIIMSNVSAIVPYIKKFHAGEVIDRNEKSLSDALIKIRRDYLSFKSGLGKFNKYFFYKKYYKSRLNF